eukprot:scaffold9449_cov49-Phaeocystis_antarctica.AAC.1
MQFSYRPVASVGPPELTSAPGRIPIASAALDCKNLRNGLGWQCVAESCPQEGRSVAEPAAGGSGAPCGGNAGCRGKRQVEAGLGRPPVLTTCETVCTRNAGDLAWPIRCAPACLAPSASLLRRDSICPPIRPRTMLPTPCTQAKQTRSFFCTLVLVTARPLSAPSSRRRQNRRAGCTRFRLGSQL